MISEQLKITVTKAVQAASERWKSAFNSGDPAGCAKEYEEDAVMHARPFGSFKGRAEIQAFWQKLIEDGLSDVDYVQPKIEVVDESTAVLTANWKMNKASGVIHKELWVLQEDGTAQLREDDFEAK